MVGVTSSPMIDGILSSARPFAIPLRNRFRRTDIREGLLLDGPAGWAEFAPFGDYDDAACVPWLRAAVDSALHNWPDALRSTVEVNTTVPVVSAMRAFELVTASGCRTAKVKVAEPGVGIDDDAERVAAVRDALGPDGRIRVDANGGWSVDVAVTGIAVLDRAAGGLEYVEQPCRTVDELIRVRSMVGVPVAADESIRLAGDPLEVARRGAADIAVIKVAPLGGVRAALRIAVECGLPVVVSSAVDTSVGLAAGLALAGALPELPYACGLGTATLLSGDVTAHPLTPAGGRLPVLPYPPAPDPALLQRFAMPTDRERFWRERLARVAALAFGCPPGHAGLPTAGRRLGHGLAYRAVPADPVTAACVIPPAAGRRSRSARGPSAGVRRGSRPPPRYRSPAAARPP
jgi:O-succinylbenzoate synthase